MKATHSIANLSFESGQIVYSSIVPWVYTGGVQIVIFGLKVNMKQIMILFE